MTVILPGGLGQNTGPRAFAGFSTVGLPINSPPPGWYSTASVNPNFSNNNRTVISGGGTLYITGTSFQTSGKRYFEVMFNGASPDRAVVSAGVATKAALVVQPGSDANSIGLNSGGGTWIVYWSASFIYSSTFATNNGDVIGVAVDFTVSGSLGVYYRFNTYWGNKGTPQAAFPSSPDQQMTITAGTGAIIMCAVGVNGSAILNTGNDVFRNPAPAGYTAWG